MTSAQLSALHDGWTSFVGPLSAAGSALVLGSAAAAGIAVGCRAATQVGPLRGVVIGLVAADLVGGLVTFQLAPTRAHYAQSPLRARMTFVAVHLQPFALPLLGLGGWRRATSRYLTAALGSVLLEAVLADDPKRRLVANLIAATASVADAADASPGQRWLGPVFLMKVIGGHGGIQRSPGQDDRW